MANKIPDFKLIPDFKIAFHYKDETELNNKIEVLRI